MNSGAAGKKKNKRKHGNLGGEDDDPNDHLGLLPENMQAHIASMPNEEERTKAINTYLNGLLFLLPEDEQNDIMGLPTMAERVVALLLRSSNNDVMDEGM